MLRKLLMVSAAGLISGCATSSFAVSGDALVQAERRAISRDLAQLDSAGVVGHATSHEWGGGRCTWSSTEILVADCEVRLRARGTRVWKVETWRLRSLGDDRWELLYGQSRG